MTIQEKKLSPFQRVDVFNLSWTTLPTGYHRKTNFPICTEEEQQALEALSYVGLIPRNVLERVFNLTRNQINNMVKQSKLVAHSMSSGSNSFSIPFYSLGENGALAIGIHASYRLNYWREYQVKDVLKRLLYFRFFEKLISDGHKIKVKPIVAGMPFVASFEYVNGDKVLVYVAKGSIDDLTTYYKWAKSKELSHRLFLVLERFEQLDMFERIFSKIPCRIVLENELFNNDESPLPQYLINQELNIVEDEKAKE